MNKSGECVKGMAFEISWSLNDGEDLLEGVNDICPVCGAGGE